MQVLSDRRGVPLRESVEGSSVLSTPEGSNFLSATPFLQLGPAFMSVKSELHAHTKYYTFAKFGMRMSA